MNKININTVATIASNLSSKPNKAEVFNMLDTIIRDCEEDKATLDEYQLAILYAHFLPAIGAKPKTPEQWVLKAMASKDAHGFLNWGYSDGKRFVATDGHRLHLIPTDLAPGFYDKALNRVEDKGKYPDFDRVIPGDGVERFDVPVGELAVEPISPGKPDLRIEVLPGYWVNKVYWDQATSGAGGEVIGLATVGGTAPLRVDLAGGGLAIIMPVRV